jgi:ABC-type sugar transport system ATPase subunit
MISHNLVDVFEVTDRIFVLRLGRRAASFDTASATQEDVVGAMTGAAEVGAANGDGGGGAR